MLLLFLRATYRVLAGDLVPPGTTLVTPAVESFWKLVSKDRSPKLKYFALKMYSMYESTYASESTYAFYDEASQI